MTTQELFDEYHSEWEQMIEIPDRNEQRFDRYLNLMAGLQSSCPRIIASNSSVQVQYNQYFTQWKIEKTKSYEMRMKNRLDLCLQLMEGLQDRLLQQENIVEDMSTNANVNITANINTNTIIQYAVLANDEHINYYNVVKAHACPSIVKSLSEVLPFRIPTSKSQLVSSYPHIFKLSNHNCALCTDWFIFRQIDIDDEAEVVSYDTGWIKLINHFCHVELLRDEAHQSSGGINYPDTTITRNNALIVRHEAKKSTKKIPKAENELLSKFVPKAIDVFPFNSRATIGIITTQTIGKLYVICYDAEECKYHLRDLIPKSFNFTTEEGKVNFLLSIAKLCRYFHTVEKSNSSFHLFPFVRYATPNGHHITWAEAGLLKEFNSNKEYAGVSLEERIHRVNQIHQLQLPHVEWGLPGGGNSIIITRIGNTLESAIFDHLVTFQQIINDVTAGLIELHNAGWAHCDISIEIFLLIKKV